MVDSGLFAAVLAAPNDDLPRLVFADWLDEHGEPERAEFIRVQVESARLGPPPLVVDERCVLEKRYGPNYYTLSGGECASGHPMILRVAAGDRVDVMRPAGNKGKPVYGLRVHRITADEVILVKDDKSQPWPGTALRKRERELWQANCLDWSDQTFGPLPHVGSPLFAQYPQAMVPFGEDGDDIILVAWSRGFPFLAECPWEQFSRHADAIRRATPLTDVRLTTIPAGFTDTADRYSEEVVTEFDDDVYTDLPGPDYGRALLTRLQRVYPGIRFELPAAMEYRQADFTPLFGVDPARPGGDYTVTLTGTRQHDGTWNLTGTLPGCP